jgi:uncharacterized protein (TIGR00369 family)
MTEAKAKNDAHDDFDARVRESFAKQPMMQTLGARLAAVRKGEVEVELPYRADLTQQHGFLHAAAVTAIVDNACGYAALSMMPPGADVLSVEFKVNLLSPAVGEKFVAVGKVLRAGKTLSVCSGEVYALQGSSRKLIGAMQATMISSKPE